MPKCTKCDEIFSPDEGDYNEEKEFVCAMCAEGFADDDVEDDEDLELDEDDDDDEDGAPVKPKACPSCKEKTEDYATSGICPECGYEKDMKED